jgi:hypothetical protein
MRQSVARCSLVIGMFWFLASPFLLDHYAGLYLLAGAAFGCAAVSGTKGWRAAGVILCAASFAIIAVAGRDERDAKIRVARAQEQLRQIRQSSPERP